MDIREALEKLSGLLDSLVGWAGADMTDEELNEIGEVEAAIHAYVCEKGDL